jgi:hypothetical protein
LKPKIDDEATVTFGIVSFGHSYHVYAKELIESILKNISTTVHFVVFCESIDVFRKLELDPRINLDIVKVPTLKWPEATIDRYRLISQHQHLFQTKYCFYIDSDAIMVAEFDVHQLFEKASGLAFVEHPGFYKRNIVFILYKRFVNPAWETSFRSRARVSPWKRREYVCGGFWGGMRTEFLKMCSDLQVRTEDDLRAQRYPRSYDESYLNWYFSETKSAILLTPKYGYVEKFPWVSKNIEEPVISFLEKSAEIVLEKKSNDKN